MLDFNYKVELQHYSEKYNSNDIINDINNIEKLEKNEEYLKPYLIKNSSRDEFTLWCEQQVESFKNPYIDGKILSGRLYANTLYAHALSYSRPGRFEPQNFVSVLFRGFCRNIPVQKPMPSLKIMLMYTLSDFT